MIKKIDKILSLITGAIGYVGYVGMVVIMVFIVADVLARGVLRQGIVGTYEIVERVLLVMLFAAFAYTQTHKGHIHVTLFLPKFPRVIQMLLYGTFELLSFITAGFCAYAIIMQGNYSLTASTTTAVLRIPLYPFYYIAAFGMFVFAITLFWDAIKCYIGIKNIDVCNEIQSTWE